MWNFIVGVILTVAIFDSINAKGLPSYLKLCKRKDPNLRQCISDNVEILRPKLEKGIPELFVPPLNPLVIPEATLSSGNNFKATFTKIQLYHTHEFKLDSFDVDLDRYRVEVKITFPKLRIIADYHINGRLLVLSLNGNGPADGNYTNVQSSMSLKGTLFRKNNKDFVRWEKEKIDINIGKISLFFERIFGDNTELNDQTNKVINENIDSIVEELQPVIQRVVSDIVFSMINRLFGRYSINELFP